MSNPDASRIHAILSDLVAAEEAAGRDPILFLHAIEASAMGMIGRRCGEEHVLMLFNRLSAHVRQRMMQ